MNLKGKKLSTPGEIATSFSSMLKDIISPRIKVAGDMELFTCDKMVPASCRKELPFMINFKSYLKFPQGRSTLCRTLGFLEGQALNFMSSSDG